MAPHLKIGLLKPDMWTIMWKHFEYNESSPNKHHLTRFEQKTPFLWALVPRDFPECSIRGKYSIHAPATKTVCGYNRLNEGFNTSAACFASKVSIWASVSMDWEKKNTSCPNPIEIHVKYIYLYIYLKNQPTIHVGKHTVRPMDPMGLSCLELSEILLANKQAPFGWLLRECCSPFRPVDLRAQAWKPNLQCSLQGSLEWKRESQEQWIFLRWIHSGYSGFGRWQVRIHRNSPPREGLVYRSGRRLGEGCEYNRVLHRGATDTDKMRTFWNLTYLSWDHS